ncbi:hypothetical protein [Adhaeribacter terreus]|uniref:SatD family (SatD) n=1 Tax=Adhaeribacter terreus TaxID=529703 RepID=A0ABW0EH58_9BACT
MKKVAVITGDVIDSTKLAVAERKKLDELLHLGLTEVAGENNFEIFRGDSFQILLQEPETALKKAIQIRCWLRKQQISSAKNNKTASSKRGIIDARLAIGIGSVSYQSKQIRTSDGEAFRLSGRALDDLKHRNSRIIIDTPSPELNDFLEVTFTLLDILISNWSVQQSEVIYELLNNQTQTAIGNKLNISQASVNQRAKTAHWPAIEKTIALFETKTAAL